MFRSKSRIYEKKTLKIGYYAACRACGATHFSLSSAHYYSAKLGYKVLYMDCDTTYENTNSVIRLRTEDTINISDMLGFRSGKLDFICGCSPTDVLRIPDELYDVIILDMHDITDEFNTLGCTDVFICASAKPWQYGSVQKSFQRIITSQYHVQGKSVFFGLTKKERIMLKDEFGITAYKMPFIADPFYLRRDEAEALSGLLPNGYV